MKQFFICLVCSVAAAHASIDVGNLQSCIEDVRQSMHNFEISGENATHFTTNYESLLSALNSPDVRDSLPQVYQQGVLDPFLNYLNRMGSWGFQSIFLYQPTNQQTAFLQQIIPDISETLLQSGSQYAKAASNAFQEVIADLYDGFLSEEKRVSRETNVPIKPPDLGVLAPLVKWGNAEAGPYTWTIGATARLALQSAIVSLPPAHLKGGLLAWATLPHETGGHDILHADKGLLEELGQKVYVAILERLNNAFLADYWRQCIDEAASDVLGHLHMGPTAGMGLIGYFRGLGGKLRNQGMMPPADTHPVDILRGYMAARVISQLDFSKAAEWGQIIFQEVSKDLSTIYLKDARTGYYYRIDTNFAIQSAQIAADTIMHSKLASLENHSLIEIQNWTDADQEMTNTLAQALSEGASLPEDLRNSGYFAVHAVAAAIQKALETGSDVQVLFDRMVTVLDAMHRYNRTWQSTSPPSICTCPCSCDEAPSRRLTQEALSLK